MREPPTQQIPGVDANLDDGARVAMKRTTMSANATIAVVLAAVLRFFLA
jgi:hypothetical protein